MTHICGCDSSLHNLRMVHIYLGASFRIIFRQHRSDYEISEGEVLSDLVSYQPGMAKGPSVANNLDHKEQIGELSVYPQSIVTLIRVYGINTVDRSIQFDSFIFQEIM